MELSKTSKKILVSPYYYVNADEHVPPFSDGRFPREAGEVGVWAQNGIA